MIGPSYTYSAKVLSIYDADTFTVEVDCGFSIKTIIPVRLFGINAPEIRGEEKEKGLEAKRFVQSILLDKDVIIKTYKKPGDKYGRWLAEIIGDFGEGNPRNLTNLLLTKGFGAPYFGD